MRSRTPRYRFGIAARRPRAPKRPRAGGYALVGLGVALLTACGTGSSRPPIAATPVSSATGSGRLPSVRPVPGLSVRSVSGPTVTRPNVPSAVVPPLPPIAGFVPPGAEAPPTAHAAPGARRGVAVFGDSLVLQALSYVQHIAKDRDQPFDGGAYGGTALCDWLPSVRRVMRTERPASLVIAFAGNNLTPCTRAPGGRRQYGAALARRYELDAQQAISAARAVGARVFLVGPPAMRDRVWDADAALLRSAMAGLAKRHAGVVYLDANELLSPNGFRAARPCQPFETAALGCHRGSIVIRAADGVHLETPLGGDRAYSAGAWEYAVLLMSGVPASERARSA